MDANPIPATGSNAPTITIQPLRAADFHSSQISVYLLRLFSPCCITFGLSPSGEGGGYHFAIKKPP